MYFVSIFKKICFWDNTKVSVYSYSPTLLEKSRFGEFRAQEAGETVGDPW